MTLKRTPKFLAGALAASIALTSIGATPAMAKPNDGVRILQGLAALYIVGRVIEGSRNNTPQTVQPHVTRRHHGVVAPHHRGVVAPRDRRVVPHRRASVPQKCFEAYNTRGGVVRGYGARCLNNNAPHLNLPQQCKTRFITYDGSRKLYRPNCLRKHGFKLVRW